MSCFFRKDQVMQRYKLFLKGLLSINILFIIFAAAIGYNMNKNRGEVVDFNEVKTNCGASVYSSKDKKVIPVGQTVGIYINTEGILVIDTCKIIDTRGQKNCPSYNKLLPGDYILSLNHVKITSKKQLVDLITNCGGEELIFEVLRNGEKIRVKVIPVETEADKYKIGIWVRDDLQGLGTITYVDEDKFGALGHSINDSDTGSKLNVSGGAIYQADIFGIEKGTEGSPGEIEGMIAYQTENIVGEISNNEIYGIYGTITREYKDKLKENDAIYIGSIDEVYKGKAYIQSYVSGEKELYEIEIKDIHKNKNGDSEMEIVVTDDNLIELTGGIVQGMSGSPIIQDDKLIGAVTHVFVDDPKKGYGIFIENMVE